jgi:hypothetical protein
MPERLRRLGGVTDVHVHEHEHVNEADLPTKARLSGGR